MSLSFFCGLWKARDLSCTLRNPIAVACFPFKNRFLAHESANYTDRQATWWIDDSKNRLLLSTAILVYIWGRNGAKPPQRTVFSSREWIAGPRCSSCCLRFRACLTNLPSHCSGPPRFPTGVNCQQPALNSRHSTVATQQKPPPVHLASQSHEQSQKLHTICSPPRYVRCPVN